MLRAAAKSARELEGEQYCEDDLPSPSPEAYAKFQKRLAHCRRRSHRLRRVILVAAVLLILAVTGAVALRLHSSALQLIPNGVYAQVHLGDDPPAAVQIEDLHQVYLITVPSGFEIVDSQESHGQRITTYRHTDKGNLYLYQSATSAIGKNVDNEVENIEAVLVGDHQGYFTVKDSANTLYWTQGGYLLGVESTVFSQAELMKLARTAEWCE